MKKIIFTLIAFVFSYSLLAQGGPKVDVIKFRGKITTAIRNTIDVPNGLTYIIHNSTTNKLEIAGDDDVWTTVGDGIQEGDNTVPSGISISQSNTNKIELIPENSGILNNEPAIRMVGGAQGSETYFVMRNNLAEITGYTIAEIDAATNASIVTKEWVLAKIASSGGGGGTDDQTLSISGDQLSIENGNTVTIPTGSGTDDQNASEVPVSDVSGNYTATDVEGVLAEVGQSLTTIPQNSSQVTYDNTTSGLSATNVKDAIDEVAASGGGGSDFDITPEAQYELLNASQKTAFRGYKTNFVINPNIFSGGASSSSDGTDFSSWTAVNGTLALETTITRNSTNALRFTGDGNGSVVAEQDIPVESNTEYEFSFSTYGSSWMSQRLVVDGADITGGTFFAPSAKNASWVENVFTLTTNGSASKITVQLQRQSGAGSQYGIIDNLKITKKVNIPEFTDTDVYVTSNKITNTEEANIGIGTANKIYSSTSDTGYKSNVLQKQMREIDSRIEDIKKTALQYYLGQTSAGTHFLTDLENDTIYTGNANEFGDLLKIPYEKDVEPNHNGTGRFVSVINLGPHSFQSFDSITFRGPYPNNTEANISGVFIHGVPQKTSIQFFNTPRGFTFTDGMRFGLRDMTISSNNVAGPLLKLDAEGTQKMTVKDSYIDKVRIIGNSAGPVFEMENFFSTLTPALGVSQFGTGIAARIRNVGDVTNFGNTPFGKWNLVTSSESTNTALVIDRVGTKQMNLLTWEMLEAGRVNVSQFDIGLGNSDATSFIFENTSNMTIGMLTAEYNPYLFKGTDLANIAVENFVFTGQSGPNSPVVKAWDLENIENFRINGGTLFGAPSTIPLHLNQVNSKQGVSISFQAMNGIDPNTNAILEGAGIGYSEIDIWENGNTNTRLVRHPSNKPYNGAAIDGDAIAGTAFDGAGTIEEALVVAAALGSGGSAYIPDEILTDNETLSFSSTQKKLFIIKGGDHTVNIPNNMPIGITSRLQADYGIPTEITFVRVDPATKFYIDGNLITPTSDDIDGFTVPKGRGATIERQTSANEIRVSSADAVAYNIPVPVTNEYLAVGSADSPDSSDLTGWNAFGTATVSSNSVAGNVRSGTTSLQIVDDSGDTASELTRFTLPTVADGTEITVSWYSKSDVGDQIGIRVGEPNGSIDLITGTGAFQLQTTTFTKTGAAAYMYIYMDSADATNATGYVDDITVTY